MDNRTPSPYVASRRTPSPYPQPSPNAFSQSLPLTPGQLTFTTTLTYTPNGGTNGIQLAPAEPAQVSPMNAAPADPVSLISADAFYWFVD